MNFIDFHTHHPSRQGETVILQGLHSWGIHPWHITEDWVRLSPPSDILALGECGLDKACNVPFALQMEVFQQHIRWSKDMERPMIIHCVRAIDDVIRLHKKEGNDLPWIIHGFRGKPQQLQSLLAGGFFVSFGFRFSEESLTSCPLDRMLLETDDEELPVSVLYEKVATLLNLPISAILEHMQHNYSTIFPFAPILCNENTHYIN